MRFRTMSGPGLVLTAAMLSLAAPSLAQTFPSRPVTLVVPWPAGQGTDAYLRVLTRVTEPHLGQPIVVDNKPGAAGTLGGATMAATAKPDGYTIAQLPITIFRLPAMQKVTWDPARDFTYVIHISGYLFTTVVRADSPWKTFRDLLDDAKANPGKVKYASSGTGGTPHIGMEIIAAHEGIKWIHVPFRGQAEQITALLGSHVDVSAGGGGLRPQVDAGQFRSLVVWTNERSPSFPDAPTLREVGLPFTFTSPFGLAGPKGLDAKVVEVLHQAFKKGLDEPEHLEFLKRFDQPYAYLDPKAYHAFAMQQIAEEKAVAEKFGLAQKQ